MIDPRVYFAVCHTALRQFFTTTYVTCLSVNVLWSLAIPDVA